MLEFDIKGVKYRAGVMDARKQMHIARRLSGLTSVFAPLAGSLAGLADAGDDERQKALLDALPSLLSGLGEVLSSMPDNDWDYVVNSCLVATERAIEGGSGWSPIVTPEGAFMFEDLRTSMSALLQIVIPILRRDISDFLSDAPSQGWGSLLGLKA